jgi:hypothetical protein
MKLVFSRSKKVRNDFDDNDLSKDDENSLSQSIFDDPTSSRTRKSFFFYYYSQSSSYLFFFIF